MKPRWQVSLTASALRDYAQIPHWTVEHFGKAQAHTYDTTLRRALKALT